MSHQTLLTLRVTSIFHLSEEFEPALGGGELCLEWANAHDAVVGAGQEEDVLLLKAKLEGDDNDDGDVDEEDDEGLVGSKVDDAKCQRAGSEDQAGQIGGQNLDRVVLAHVPSNLYSRCNFLPPGCSSQTFLRGKLSAPCGWWCPPCTGCHTSPPTGRR